MYMPVYGTANVYVLRWYTLYLQSLGRSMAIPIHKLLTNTAKFLVTTLGNIQSSVLKKKIKMLPIEGKGQHCVSFC